MQSLFVLLWSLATLHAAQQRPAAPQLQPLLQAVTQQLAGRMEAVLGSRASITSVASTASGTLDEQGDGSGGPGWYAGPGGSSTGSQPATSAELSHLPTATLCTAVWACGQLRHADARMLQAATTLLHGRVNDMAAGDMARCARQAGCGPLAALAHRSCVSWDLSSSSGSHASAQ